MRSGHCITEGTHHDETIRTLQPKASCTRGQQIDFISRISGSTGFFPLGFP